MLANLEIFSDTTKSRLHNPTLFHVLSLCNVKANA